MYEGRQIRVQIREHHPHRIPFKFNGYERGRHPFQRRGFRPDLQFNNVHVINTTAHDGVNGPLKNRNSLVRKDGDDIYVVQTKPSPTGSPESSRPSTTVHTTDPVFPAQAAVQTSDASQHPAFPTISSTASLPPQSTMAYQGPGAGYFVAQPWVSQTFPHPTSINTGSASNQFFPSSGPYEGSNAPSVSPGAYPVS